MAARWDGLSCLGSWPCHRLESSDAQWIRWHNDLTAATDKAVSKQKGTPAIAKARLFLAVESLTAGHVPDNNLADSCQLAGLERLVDEA